MQRERMINVTMIHEQFVFLSHALLQSTMVMALFFFTSVTLLYIKAQN